MIFVYLNILQEEKKLSCTFFKQFATDAKAYVAKSKQYPLVIYIFITKILPLKAKIIRYLALINVWMNETKGKEIKWNGMKGGKKCSII